MRSGQGFKPRAFQKGSCGERLGVCSKGFCQGMPGAVPAAVLVRGKEGLEIF